jgi:FixJ family two-component response regulator
MEAAEGGYAGSVAVADTVLIAVRDVVLADSLRFSLELEGYDARFYEAPTGAMPDGVGNACLLLDQDVFADMVGSGNSHTIGRLGVPTVLMVNQRTQRVLDYALAAGVTTIVEKPLLGGVLFDAIRSALAGAAR